jgi:DNA-binding GntR family transcriptional regulator
MTIPGDRTEIAGFDRAGDLTTQQIACTYLREQILSGNFAAGMRLKTEELAEMLGVSRMPIRDALQQLHSEGLVEIRPNRGAVVTRLTADEILELFEIRAALEGLAARHACDNLRASDLTTLEAILGQMNRATEDLNSWLKLHDEFHDFICIRSNRPRLFRQIRTARQAATPYVRMLILVSHRVEMPSAEHDLLISIARRGNSELFEATMRDHVLSAGHGVASFLREKAAEIAKAEQARGREQNTSREFERTDQVEP